MQWCFASGEDSSASLANLTPFFYGIWTEAQLLRGRHHGHVTFIAVFSSDLPLTLSVVQSLSPRVALCPPDGVFVEVSARVEGDILKQLIERIDRSVVLKTGVASTRTAAFLAARFRSGSTVPAGKEREFSATFPIQPLFPYSGTHPDLFKVLDHWGIRTMGQLADLPERELSLRLGKRDCTYKGWPAVKTPNLFIQG